VASEWVDFKAVKEAISMEMVLGRYNVRLRKVNSTYFRGKCPLPTHTSKGSGDSFGTDTSKNAWACQSDSCVKIRSGKKGGNVIDFVAVMENCSIRDAAIKLANWFNVSSDGGGGRIPERHTEPSSSKQLVAEKEREVEVTEVVPSGENKPLSFVLKNIDHSHAYLTARGIAPGTSSHFGVGYFSGKGSMANRVVIPIHNEAGELVAYAGRAIDASEPKYKFPSGFLKSIELFNLHRTAGEKMVVVVEGFFDCMKVTAAGWTSVALMGSSMSDEQERLLAEHFTAAWLVLDGDEAGRSGTRDIVQRLVRKMFVRAVELPDGTQPDMLRSEEINTLLT
jgi:DNA primase